MTGTENVFDGFALLGDDEEFDVDKIFGSGSDELAPPPPAPALAEEVKSPCKDAGSTGRRKTASGTLFSVYKRRK